MKRFGEVSFFQRKGLIDKFLLVFLMSAILLLGVFFAPASGVQAENEQVYICTANFCYLYEAPAFTSQKVVGKNGEPLRIAHKDEIILELTNNSPTEYDDEYGMIFYKVDSFSGEQLPSAYIFSDFVALGGGDIETYPAYNASINSNTKLYLLNGETMTESEIEIEKGERVYLYEGYNKDLEFTPIAYQRENSLQYGYVLTDTIVPDGVNPLIIYAVTIAIACIGIIMALLFMKNKKKKK